ncbi:HesA/MoeB/ThiF family protein [Mesorhizobium sp. CA7]|uniref:HesA/MoeB/ThiF family protein n=1 Tax=Mesorhizobium sp. CA7 TaxID=588501 RepID=UPI001CCBA117|nr:ThiF family adenylyltransferase [Mesorhizobium sp. CA7]MBZ9815744.1 ThiF family adenylyltransferase [Mesorhizobium sp. CA7]
MSGHRITLLGTQHECLSAWLDGHPEGHERGAVVLFRRFERNHVGLRPSIRFVCVDIIEMQDDWVLDSSPVHLRINLRKMQDVYFRCEQEGLELGFVHNHPGGFLEFSEKDEDNEKRILKGYAGCNGNSVALVALLWAGGRWRARVRRGDTPQQTEAVRHVAVLGANLDMHIYGEESAPSEVLKRQAAAFGAPFNRKLQSLRVAVIGVGGTGSSVATLLARSGVGELILIDGDVLEVTNLNRVRGYRAQDVKRNKAKALTAYLQSLELPGVSVSAIGEYLDKSPDAIDAISGVDVIFGCTDDVAGRDLLNQATYYYALAFIDIGLTGKIDTGADGEPYLRDHRGRISCILPEDGKCLRCQKVVTQQKLDYERELRARPELAKLDKETLKQEYYLVGGGELAPGVGPFTSASADTAVATLMDLVRPFRKIPGDLLKDNIWYDFVHMVIHSNAHSDDPDCFCCGPEGLKLKRERGYRLDMPALGKIT